MRNSFIGVHLSNERVGQSSAVGLLRWMPVLALVLVLSSCAEAPRDPNRVVSAAQIKPAVAELRACIADEEASEKVDRMSQIKAIVEADKADQLRLAVEQLVPAELRTMDGTGALMETAPQRVAVWLAAMDYAVRNPNYSAEQQLRISSAKLSFLAIASRDRCPVDPDIPQFFNAITP